MRKVKGEYNFPLTENSDFHSTASSSLFGYAHKIRHIVENSTHIFAFIGDVSFFDKEGVLLAIVQKVSILRPRDQIIRREGMHCTAEVESPPSQGDVFVLTKYVWGIC